MLENITFNQQWFVVIISHLPFTPVNLIVLRNGIIISPNLDFPYILFFITDREVEK